MQMAFLSRGFKNLQWYSMTKQKPLISKKNLGNQGLFAASAYGLRPAEKGVKGCKNGVEGRRTRPEMGLDDVPVSFLCESASGDKVQ